jgi:hypothetical protein
MKRTRTVSLGWLIPGWLILLSLLGTTAVLGQSGPAPTGGPPSTSASAPGGPSAQGEPISYASVSELNGLLAQLEANSKTTQSDLARLRIDRWKTDSSYKKQILGNVESIQRNLQSALPEIIGQLRAAPEDLPATFKLYRNLDALYDVLGSVTESAGAFGGKDDFQALANDLSAFETSRKQMAQRIETLSSSKEAEINRLRAELKTAKAAIPAPPPKKIVVDDAAPAKKPAAKRRTSHKPATPATPPAQTEQPPPSKPQ